MTAIRRDVWTTYRTTSYTHDVANDQRSAGGVHKHQVRRTATGWQYRIAQINGGHVAYSAVDIIDDAEGEAAFAAAKQR